MYFLNIIKSKLLEYILLQLELVDHDLAVLILHLDLRQAVLDHFLAQEQTPYVAHAQDQIHQYQHRLCFSLNAYLHEVVNCCEP